MASPSPADKPAVVNGDGVTTETPIAAVNGTAEVKKRKMKKRKEVIIAPDPNEADPAAVNGDGVTTETPIAAVNVTAEVVNVKKRKMKKGKEVIIAPAPNEAAPAVENGDAVTTETPIAAVNGTAEVVKVKRKMKKRKEVIIAPAPNEAAPAVENGDAVTTETPIAAVNGTAEVVEVKKRKMKKGKKAITAPDPNEAVPAVENGDAITAEAANFADVNGTAAEVKMKKKRKKVIAASNGAAAAKRAKSSSASDTPVIGNGSAVAADLSTKRGVRVKGNRVYDSENGVCCHQCRQKTLDFMAKCKNRDRNCPLSVCHKCLFNRYRESAEKAVQLDDWKCPRCRGKCNCSYCRKKKGLAPTGAFLDTLTANSLKSTSDVLHLKPRKDHSKSKKKGAIASTQEYDKSNNYDEDSELHNGKGLKRVRSHDDSEGLCEINNDNGEQADNNGSQRSRIFEEESTKSRLKKILEMAMEAYIEESELLKDKESVVEIPLPEGNEITNVLDISMLAEDVGHALQFLEFCEAFGQVLYLSKGQPEAVLRDLMCGRSRRRMEDSATVQLHIRLLALIQNQSEKKYRLSWLKDLSRFISESSYLKELELDHFDFSSGYDELDPSRKLRIVNFLCDEALGTEVLKSWIDEQNSEYAEKEKIVKEEALAKEKSMKAKLQNVMVRALFSKSSPVFVSDHHDLIAIVKPEADQILAQAIEAADTGPKLEQRSDAVRSEPMIMDESGRKLWKLKNYLGGSQLLIQDFNEDLLGTKDRWFVVDAAQKIIVENHISSGQETIVENRISSAQENIVENHISPAQETIAENHISALGETIDLNHSPFEQEAIVEKHISAHDDIVRDHISSMQEAIVEKHIYLAQDSIVENHFSSAHATTVDNHISSARDGISSAV